MTINPSQQQKPYAVIIGGANMDICGAPSFQLQLNDSNPGKITSSPGGVARNIAENIARLGIDSRLVAAIGGDHFGILLLQQGQVVGINMDAVLRVETVNTSTYLSVLDNDGDMRLAINDMSIVDHLTPEYLQMCEQSITLANVIIVDTNVSEKSLAYLTETYKEKHLIVDTVSAVKAVKIKPYLKGVHTLKANKLEAEALCGFKDDFVKMANWLHDQGVKRLYITLGADGVFYSEKNEHGTVSLKKHQNIVKNANGAGDAFVAGIAYAYLQSWSMIKTVHFALSAANVALAHSSTINPAMSVAEVNKIMEKEYGS